jgi:hypothetical protein
LQRKEWKSSGPEPITAQHIIATGLRILSGGRPKNQRHIIGSCLDAAYKGFNDFLDAVNQAPELSIEMPQTPEDWDMIYKQFKQKSLDENMAGCVGCLDGFFQCTNKPTKQEMANVLSYHSGHYKSYGLNCQGCVKADLQFIFLGVVTPGLTNDNISFTFVNDLKEVFSNLPPSIFELLDAAYT